MVKNRTSPLSSVQADICYLISDLFFGNSNGIKSDNSFCSGMTDAPDWDEIYKELNSQKITLLFSDYLIHKRLPAVILDRWKTECLGRYEYNIHVLNVHDWLDRLFTEKGIPYVVIKGFSAAFLYRRPLLRNQGDIDIIVPPDFFADAIKTLDEADCISMHPGLKKLSDNENQELSPRHYTYKKNLVEIEVHARFATLNNRKEETLLDQLIYDAIPNKIHYQSISDIVLQDAWYYATKIPEWGHSSKQKLDETKIPLLPDDLQGLILLTHINQHLEEGLGFRQILDWMMFVYQFLDDEGWVNFRDKAALLGLEKLAIVVTRMCQLYLGLPEHFKFEHHTAENITATENNQNTISQERIISWTDAADKELCADLLTYLFECGDFGEKQGIDNSAAMVFSHGRGIKAFFRNLQKRGEANWALYKRHPSLKGFAWIYQGCRYAKIAIAKKRGLHSIRKSIMAGKQRGDMLDKLGATSLTRKR